MPGHLVHHFHVRQIHVSHFQSTWNNTHTHMLGFCLTKLFQVKLVTKSKIVKILAVIRIIINNNNNNNVFTTAAVKPLQSQK